MDWMWGERERKESRITTDFDLCNWVNGGSIHKYGGKAGGTDFSQNREK